MADELITKHAFDALTDTYITHPLMCPCETCTSMDDLLDAMCIRSGCRQPRQPGHMGCEKHPQRPGPPTVRGGPHLGPEAEAAYREEQNDRD